MFGLFKKKNPGIKIIDKVCIAPEGRLELLYNAWMGNKATAVLFWFDDTLQAATDYFTSKTNEPVLLLLARETSALQLAGKKIIFGEHYPLRTTENAFFEKLNLQQVEIYSSLHDPLFRLFGGERLTELMQRMGLQPNEPVEHSMISNSIKNAQEKLEKKISFEKTARTAESWFSMNYSG